MVRKNYLILISKLATFDIKDHYNEDKFNGYILPCTIQQFPLLLIYVELKYCRRHFQILNDRQHMEVHNYEDFF